MPKLKRHDPKLDALREQGALNRRAQAVSDPLFQQDDAFFDRRDLVQLKYEMLRRVRTDGQPVSKAAAAFGLSRPSFYHAHSAFEAGGLPALLPKKRGPRGAHKLSVPIVATIEHALAHDATLSLPALARLVKERCGIAVHPRSIERALARKKKPR